MYKQKLIVIVIVFFFLLLPPLPTLLLLIIFNQNLFSHPSCLTEGFFFLMGKEHHEGM